jgi:hypothetical protein
MKAVISQENSKGLFYYELLQYIFENRLNTEKCIYFRVCEQVVKGKTHI